MPDATAADVGEFGLIDAVVARLSSAPQVLVGPGDDAAVVVAPDGRVVVTTDVLVQGVHFRVDWSSAIDVGRKAAAASLADVAAMGGTATALVVGLAAPASLPVAWAMGLADGLRDEAAQVGAAVVGGDVANGDRIVVSVTALGDLAGRSAVLRSGARPGQQLVLAGSLGRSAAGLALLEQGLAAAPGPVESEVEGNVAGLPVAGPVTAGARYTELIAAHRRPTPPYAFGPLLADLGATAMCDVSDGLLADLAHLAEASGVGFEVEAAALPVTDLLADAALQCGHDPLDWVLTGGEDHALIATVPAGTELPSSVIVIGWTIEGQGVHVRGHTVKGAGWEHFS